MAEITKEELTDAIRAALEIVPSVGFTFHTVKVDETGTVCNEFEGSANFERHVHRELTQESGLPTRMYCFWGARIEFSKPQVTVGLTTAGQKKAKAVILTKSTENPHGEVPDRKL